MLDSVQNVIPSDKEKETIAGVKRSVQERMLHHTDFKTVLETLEPLLITQNNIISKKHVISTVNQTKIGLNALDTKRYILDDGISILTYGHFETL